MRIKTRIWVPESGQRVREVTLGMSRPPFNTAFLSCGLEGSWDAKVTAFCPPHLLEIRDEGDESAVGFAQIKADAVRVAVRLQTLLDHLAVGQPHSDP